VWMTVVESVREGADFVIDLRPYAIHGEARAAYYALVSRALRAS